MKSRFMHKIVDHRILCNLNRMRLFQVLQCYPTCTPILPLNTKFPTTGCPLRIFPSPKFGKPFIGWHRIITFQMIHNSIKQGISKTFIINLFIDVLCNDICRVCSNSTIFEFDFIQTCVENWVGITFANQLAVFITFSSLHTSTLCNTFTIRQNQTSRNVFVISIMIHVISFWHCWFRFLIIFIRLKSRGLKLILIEIIINCN